MSILRRRGIVLGKVKDETGRFYLREREQHR